MVVPSSGWIQNVTDPNQNKSMFATGILICHDNSYPFQERTLLLDQPIKIGRSVARARAGTDNAIFDCKVLSRNHALLWYDSGKFYLKDTKSSNGTFVNNKRLSPSGEESSACELNSGDIVQFGVDVVESTKKVTHGCIVATLKLYLPDGKEAKSCPSNSVTYVNVTLEDLYKLNQFIQEAGRRENALRSKLEYMQQLLEHTRVAANQSWKALVVEDCLLSRLEMLENQVIVYSKNFGEEKLRLELLNLLEDKTQYQALAKELLKKKVQEKREIIGKVQILKCRLHETEELTHSLHNIIKDNQNELQELAIKYINMQQALHDTTEKLNKTKLKLKEVLKQSELDKQEFVKKLETQNNNNQNLQISLSDPNLDSVNIHKQISAIRNHLQTLQDTKYYINNSDGAVMKNESNMIDTFNFFLANWNSMFIKILESDLSVNKNEKREVYIIDDVKLKNSFHTLENILYNQLHLVPDKNMFKYILPSLTNKAYVLEDDLMNHKFLDQICLDSQTPHVMNSCKLKMQITKNILLSELNENVETKEKKSLQVIMKLPNNDLKNLNFEKKTRQYSPHNITFIDSKKISKSKFLSTEIIKAAQQINKLIDESQHMLPKQKRIKIEEIYSNNNCVINSLETILNTKVTFNECFYGFLSQNILVLSDLATIIDHNNSNFDKKFKKIKQLVVGESNEVIINKLKEYLFQVEDSCNERRELSEQLIILKEKYTTLIEEKANITQKYVNLKSQHKNFFISSYMVPIYYVVPLLITIIWLVAEKMK